MGSRKMDIAAYARDDGFDAEEKGSIQRIWSDSSLDGILFFVPVEILLQIFRVGSNFQKSFKYWNGIEVPTKISNMEVIGGRLASINIPPNI